VAIIINWVGAAPAGQFKPPGFDQVKGLQDMQSTACHTVAAAAYVYLTTGATPTSQNTQTVINAENKKHDPTNENICNGSPSVIYFGVGVGRPYDTNPTIAGAFMVDHWFTVQTYGDNAKYAMVYQGYCGSYRASQDAKYSGTQWITPIANYISTGTSTPSDKVPAFVSDMPMLCSALEDKLKALTGATGAKAIEDAYNYMFAPPGDLLEVPRSAFSRAIGIKWGQGDRAYLVKHGKAGAYASLAPPQPNFFQQQSSAHTKRLRFRKAAHPLN